ncbi:MAG: hypothetical protein QF489_08580 [Planctomycetota bacterium]|jgi:hypothetical protein|nr:hypothetical protein [Planctomycetota bacterium]
MTNHPNNPELPERLTQDLRALGGTKAPEELWERVQLGLALGEVEEAPADLWSRVEPQLAAIAAPDGEKPAGRVLHNQAWGRRLSIAAALMICAGIGYRFMGPAQVDPGAALAGPVSAADRAAFRAKVVFMEVSATELSSVANGFAQGLGGITAEDDA